MCIELKKGYLYIAVAVVAFSSMEVVLKFIAGEINPIQLTFARFFIGFLFLLPVAMHTLKKRQKKLNWATLSYFALLGLVGIAICMPMFQMSVGYIDSGVVAVLFSCNPVFITLFAYLILKEPIKKRNLVALALEILGAVVIINPFQIRLNPIGIGLALVSTVLFAVYGVMGKRKCAEYGGAVVTCFSFLFGSIIILLFIGLTHLPAVSEFFNSVGLSVVANVPLFRGYTLHNLPYVLYVSAGVAGIGFCAYFLAMEYQPASVVSLVYFFKPALSPVLAWLVHGENIPPNMVAGIVLILTGSLASILPSILESRRGESARSTT